MVRTEKVGRVRTCRIETAGFSVAEQWIEDRRPTWERRLDRLENLLEEEGCSLPPPTNSPTDPTASPKSAADLQSTVPPPKTQLSQCGKFVPFPLFPSAPNPLFSNTCKCCNHRAKVMLQATKLSPHPTEGRRLRRILPKNAVLGINFSYGGVRSSTELPLRAERHNPARIPAKLAIWQLGVNTSHKKNCGSMS